MRDRASGGQDLVTPCVNLLRRLHLSEVGDDWVAAVWDGQFTESPDLPPDYEECVADLGVAGVFARLRDLIHAYTTQQRASDEESAADVTNMSVQSNLHRWVVRVDHLFGTFLGRHLLLSKFMVRTDFWALMTEENIQYRVLVALLYHHMDRGLEHCKEEPSRALALAAAGLYLAFVSLPGRKIVGNRQSNDSY